MKLYMEERMYNFLINTKNFKKMDGKIEIDFNKSKFSSNDRLIKRIGMSILVGSDEEKDYAYNSLMMVDNKKLIIEYKNDSIDILLHKRNGRKKVIFACCFHKDVYISFYMLKGVEDALTFSLSTVDIFNKNEEEKAKYISLGI